MIFKDALTVAGTLTVSDGEASQSTFNVTADGISVSTGASYKNLSTGDLTLGVGGVSNSGTVTIDANGAGSGDNDDILIRSTVAGTQRSWTGSGTYDVADVDVKDQAGTATITPPSSTNSGNNGVNWFPFPARINFQPAAAPVPSGYEVDSGAVFGDRGNGYTGAINGRALLHCLAHHP